MPDMSICKDCLNEMREPENRRFGYEFINCTNCGPRYSIIEGVPYDRVNTTMKNFTMCDECRREYENPLNRRYHAQPISCSACGPTLFLYDKKELICKGSECVKLLAHHINNGAIVGFKGVGGFVLMCSANSTESVRTLRERKKRPTKPFAIMCKNIERVKELAYVSKQEQELICSIERPIVIVKRKDGGKICKLVAPNTDRYGLFLPYSPLHVELFEYLDCDIVATSANISGEPIVADILEFNEKLIHVVDFVLDYNREIVGKNDDSVMQVVDGKSSTIRLSRAYAPYTFLSDFKCNKSILAVGAHQKNSIAFFHNGKIVQSGFIGDLDSVEGVGLFCETIERFKKFYNLEFELIICDAHPAYESTKWAKSQGVEVVEILHHHAHLASVAFENSLQGSYLGVAFDPLEYNGGFVLNNPGNIQSYHLLTLYYTCSILAVVSRANVPYIKNKSSLRKIYMYHKQHIA